MKTKLVVGLGNPGEQYSNSRHNVGFMCIDFLAEHLEVPLKFEKKKTRYGKKVLRQLKASVILLKPQTFSNYTAEAVLYIASFYKILRSDIFIVYDELEARLASLKVDQPVEKISHNGIKNLVEFMRSSDFVRCGIGIGPLPPAVVESKFYLSPFLPREREKIEAAFKKIAAKVEVFLRQKSVPEEPLLE